jgi:hypothetical protein
MRGGDCVIVVRLPGVGHVLRDPVPVVIVGDGLDSAVGQRHGVGAGGGVAVPRLLLVEVCPAVVIADPVLVGVGGRRAEVLVRSRGGVLGGGQAGTQEGEQQEHLGEGTGLGSRQGEWVLVNVWV